MIVGIFHVFYPFAETPNGRRTWRQCPPISKQSASCPTESSGIDYFARVNGFLKLPDQVRRDLVQTIPTTVLGLTSILTLG
jgi:hypothetical protein